MSDFWTIVGQNWLTYIFGDPLIAGIVIMLFITMIGLRLGFEGEYFVVLGMVGIGVMVSMSLLPEYIELLGLIVGGFIFGLALSRIWGSR